MIQKLAFCLTLLVSYNLNSCTAFHLKSVDGAQIYCRSMEFGFNLESDLLITPKNMSFIGTTPNKNPGLKWTNTYGYVGMNTFFAKSLVCDGMNEKGLVVGMLFMPKYATYETFDPVKTNSTIGGWEVATYLLGTCATINEAKDALTNIHVVQQPFPTKILDDSYLPLHYYITDPTGNVIVIEYINGNMVTHENPVKVLTNSPSFDWHLTNLSNYIKMTPVNAPKLQLSNLKIQGFGEGTGLLGLPGDYTPQSRFVRATLFSQWATSQKEAIDTVSLGFQILNTFEIFEGIVKAPKKNYNNVIETSDFTQWTLIFDTSNLKTFFRGSHSLKVQMVDLNKIDFSMTEHRIVQIDKTFSFEDDTAKTTPLNGSLS